MPSTGFAIKLPPLPSLDVSHLAEESARHDTFGPLHALRPGPECYQCKDTAAPSLVLVPGLGMDGLGFLRQLPLGVCTDLHLFQMPNEPFAGERGLDSFARCAEEYILKRGLDRRPGGLIIGGCSMGGAVSLAIARRGRVKLRGLVLIGTFGAAKHLPLWQRVGAPLSWLIPLPLLRRAAREAVVRTNYFGQVTKLEGPWLLGSKIRRTQSYFARAVMALTRMNQIEAAGKLTVPTLVIHGTRDHVLPYKAGQELAATIPGARLVTVEGSGHAVFFTHAEEVNREIAEFIQKLP